MHVAAASTAVAEQLVGPDTPYPSLHVNWHVEPAARVLVHVPSAPLVGAVTPVHGAAVERTSSLAPSAEAVGVA